MNPLLVPGHYPSPGGVDESIAADDSELEEGEVSPPRSEPLPNINIGNPTFHLKRIARSEKDFIFDE